MKLPMKIWALIRLPRFIKDLYKADISWYGCLPEGTVKLDLKSVLECWKIIWWDD